MAYYISAYSYNKQRNNEFWSKIASENFTEELEKEMDDLRKKIVELDRNPRSIIDSAILKEIATLERKKWNISMLRSDVESLHDAIDDKSNGKISTSIISIDNQLGDIINEMKFTEPLHPFHEFFCALFQYGLNLNIEKDFDSTVSLVSQDNWLQLFKRIDADLVIKAIGVVEDNAEDKQVQKYYFETVKDVRDVLRYCIKTKSEFRVSDELYDSNSDSSVRDKERINEIRVKFFEK